MLTINMTTIVLCVSGNVLKVVGKLQNFYHQHDEQFVARMGEDRGVHRVLVGKPEGKRPLGRPRR